MTSTEQISPAAEPPSDLDGAARDLWVAVTEQFELRPDELPLLTAACRTLAEIEAMEKALVDADPLVAGSKGQQRPNPLFSEVRAHRITLRQLLGALGLQDAFDDGNTGEGAARSSAGRKLAGHRWHRG